MTLATSPVRSSVPPLPNPVPDLAWETWGRWMSSLWQGMEVGLGLQQQCMHRWTLRQQEAWRHWQQAGAAALWWDVSLAGMRWTLQEWDQALQDGMAAPVFLRGQVPGQELDWLSPCSQGAQLPWQVWAQCWAAAGRQRPR